MFFQILFAGYQTAHGFDRFALQTAGSVTLGMLALACILLPCLILLIKQPLPAFKNLKRMF